MSNQIVRPVLSNYVTSISDLKKNPMAVVNQSGGEPVAVLNRNQPAFYCVEAEMFERFLDYIEDTELAQMVRDRQGEEVFEVNLDDL